MELKTSGSSISSESWESSDDSDSTCSTSLSLRNLYHKISKGQKKNIIHNSQIIYYISVVHREAMACPIIFEPNAGYNKKSKVRSSRCSIWKENTSLSSANGSTMLCDAC